MPNYNKVQLIGHICKDIDVKYSASGTAWTQNSIAVNNNYTKRDGTEVEETMFIDFSCFGRTAENMGEYLHKGSCVFIEGELKLNRWEDDEGNARSKHNINVQRLIFLDRRGSDSEQPQSQLSSYQEDPQQSPSEDEENTDIPF